MGFWELTKEAGFGKVVFGNFVRVYLLICVIFGREYWWESTQL